jgi:hypothetical protein
LCSRLRHSVGSRVITLQRDNQKHAKSKSKSRRWRESCSSPLVCFPLTRKPQQTTPAGRCSHSPGPQQTEIRRHFLLLTSQSRRPCRRRPKNLEIGQCCSFSSFTCGEKDEKLKNWSGKWFGSCLSLAAYRAGRD